MRSREPSLVPVPPEGYWPYPAQIRAPASIGGDPDGMDFFRKLWRCKLLIVGAAVAGALLAGLIASTLEPRYAAEARILLGVEKPKVTDIEAILQQTTPDQEVVQSESYVLQSRSLAGQVAHRLALDQDPEFNPALRPPPPWWRQQISDFKSWLKDDIVKPLLSSGEEASSAPAVTEEERLARQQESIVSRLLGRINVEPLQRSHVLSIQAESENPQTAARIANGVANTYIEQQMVRAATATQTANTWLDQRIAELRDKVEQAERATEEYRREHGLYETRNDAITAQQVSELNSQLILAESEQASAEARLAQAEAVKNNQVPFESLPAVLSSPLIQALKQQQTEIARQSAEFSSIYGPQHPKMRDINAQSGDIQGKIAAEVRKIVEGLRHEVQAYRARSGALRNSLAQLQGKMGEVNEKSIGLRELERQAEANRRLLVSFLDRAKETASQPGLDQPSAVVISEAAVPLSPSFPPTTMLVLLGLIGGGLIGILAGLIRENMDRTFRTAQQVEDATNLPILGVLPPPDRRTFAGVRAARRSNSAFGHAVSNLFERLVFSPASRARKVLMLTSATPREGKSRIAMSLVRMVTGSGLRVIVLDCDWRRPTMHAFFARSMTPGLGDLLAGTATPDEVVFRDPQTGAHAIFAGDISQIANSAERFARLRVLLATLSRHYDLVILDTPPVLAGPDALALAEMAEEIAFVIRWGQVPRDAILEALNHLEMAGARFGGAILSGVDPKRYRRYGAGDALYTYAERPVPRAA